MGKGSSDLIPTRAGATSPGCDLRRPSPTYAGEHLTARHLRDGFASPKTLLGLMHWNSTDRLVWIAFLFISGLSTVNALSIIVDRGLVPGSGALFWIATAFGSAVVAGLCR